MSPRTRSMTRSERGSSEGLVEETQRPATPVPSPRTPRGSARSSGPISPSSRVSKASSARRLSKSSSKRGSARSSAYDGSPTKRRTGARAESEGPGDESLGQEMVAQATPPAMVTAETQTNGPGYANAGEPSPELDGSFQIVGSSAPRGKISVQNFTNRRSTFARGTIIRLPSHQPNMDPTKTRESALLKSTPVGGVISKLRMGVVLWKFARNMHILPIYSYQGRGIAKQPKEFHDQYVEICNDADRKRRFVKKGVHDVLGADMNSDYTLDRLSCVDMSAGFSANYAEDIQIVGMLVRQSNIALRGLMASLLTKDNDEERRA